MAAVGHGTFAYSLASECDPTSFHADTTYASCVGADWCLDQPYAVTIAENGLACVLCTDPTRPRTPHAVHIEKLVASHEQSQASIGSGWHGVHFIGKGSQVTPTPIISVAMSSLQGSGKSPGTNSLNCVCLATHGVALWEIASNSVKYYPWSDLCGAVRLPVTALSGKPTQSCYLASDQVAVASATGTLAILRHSEKQLDISSSCSLPQSVAATSIACFHVASSAGTVPRLAVGTSQSSVLVYDTLPDACAVAPKPLYVVHVGPSGSTSGAVPHLASNATQDSVASGLQASIAALHESGIVSLWPTSAGAAIQPHQISPMCPLTSKRAVKARWLAMPPTWASHPMRPQVLLLPQTAPASVFCATVDTTKPVAGFKHDGRHPVFPVVTGGYTQVKVRSAEASYWKVGQLTAFQSTIEEDVPVCFAANLTDTSVFLVAIPRGVSVFGCLAVNPDSVLGRDCIERSRQVLGKRYNFIQKKASRQFHGPIMSAISDKFASLRFSGGGACMASLQGGATLTLAGGAGAHASVPLHAGLADTMSLLPRCGLQLSSLCLDGGVDMPNSPLAHCSSVSCTPTSSDAATCAVAWHILQRCTFVRLQTSTQPAAGAGQAAYAGTPTSTKAGWHLEGQVLGTLPGTSAAAAWSEGCLDADAELLGAVVSCRVGAAPITKPEKTANPGAAAAVHGMSEAALEGVLSTVQIVAMGGDKQQLSTVDVDFDEEPEWIWGGPALCVCMRSRTKGILMRLLQWPSAAQRQAAGKKGVKLVAIGPNIPGPNAVHWCSMSGSDHAAGAFLGCFEYETVLQFVLLHRQAEQTSLQAVGKVNIPRGVVVTDMALQGQLVVLRTSASLSAVALPVLLPRESTEAPPTGLPSSVQKLLSTGSDPAFREGMLGMAGLCVPLPLPADTTSFHSALVHVGPERQLHLAVPGASSTVPIESLCSGLGRALVYLSHGMLPSALAECQARCSHAEQLQLHDAGTRLGFYAWSSLMQCMGPHDVAQYAETYLSGDAGIQFAECWRLALLPSLLQCAGGDSQLAKQLAEEVKDETDSFQSWLALHAQVPCGS